MSGTGIVRAEIFLEHDPGPWHVETPARLKAIYGLLDRGDLGDLSVVTPRPATREEITLIHRPSHFDLIAGTAGQAQGYLDADTQTSARSFEAALEAAGGLIRLVEAVLDGELENGFALVRPPGHHAEANRAMGFCLFNNVAVAAAWAIKERGLTRIMIVDWDLHHGNGTQHSFYSDPRVLYLSTHQYPFYPGSGSLSEVGEGPGRGFTLNVPLSPGHGDQEYVAIFQKVLFPATRAFRPELILVSAGFDIYYGDPLGAMNVSPEGFAALTRLLKTAAEELCAGRLVFTLEGGYHVEGQAEGVGRVLEVLSEAGPAGRDLAQSDPPEPAIISRVRQAQAEFWAL